MAVDVYMIDNYDSFTWNVVQYLWELDAAVEVGRNDEVTLEDIDLSGSDLLCISPGPCSPDEAGISVPAIHHFKGRLPIFGICLGMQSIGAAFGGHIVRAPSVMHGKTSEIHHDGRGVFEGLPTPFTATRDHSLVIDPETCPDCLEVSAWTVDAEGNRDVIMGVRHRELAVEGVQFHPESILTEHGHDMLANFLKQAG